MPARHWAAPTTTSPASAAGARSVAARVRSAPQVRANTGWLEVNAEWNARRAATAALISRSAAPGPAHGKAYLRTGQNRWRGGCRASVAAPERTAHTRWVCQALRLPKQGRRAVADPDGFEQSARIVEACMASENGEVAALLRVIAQAIRDKAVDD